MKMGIIQVMSYEHRLLRQVCHDFCSEADEQSHTMIFDICFREDNEHRSVYLDLTIETQEVYQSASNLSIPHD